MGRFGREGAPTVSSSRPAHHAVRHRRCGQPVPRSGTARSPAYPVCIALPMVRLVPGGMRHAMQADAQRDHPLYLTTKEVAALLRVKERKVYDLAASGGIPHRRVTGKLLFPSAEILAWIEGAGTSMPRERPAVLTGSHDPLLDWAVRESGSTLATLFNGSVDGLKRFSKGRAALAGIHIPEHRGWNVQTAEEMGIRASVLIAWAVRARGLILSDRMQGEVTQMADLRETGRPPPTGSRRRGNLRRSAGQSGVDAERPGPVKRPCPDRKRCSRSSGSR